MNMDEFSPMHIFNPCYKLNYGYQSDACECNQLVTAVMARYKQSDDPNGSVLNSDIEKFFDMVMKVMIGGSIDEVDHQKRMLTQLRVINSFNKEFSSERLNQMIDVMESPNRML